MLSDAVGALAGVLTVGIPYTVALRRTARKTAVAFDSYRTLLLETHRKLDDMNQAVSQAAVHIHKAIEHEQNERVG